MKPKFRAWSKAKKIMSDVKKIDFCNGLIDTRSFEELEIEKVVLMQSARIKDKNGKEIFEGDVVELYGETILPVLFEDGCFGTRFLSGITPLVAIGSEFIEILGNIHEHPELLKQVVTF